MSGPVNLSTGWHPLQQDVDDRVQALYTGPREAIIRKRKTPEGGTMVVLLVIFQGNIALTK